MFSKGNLAAVEKRGAKGRRDATSMCAGVQPDPVLARLAKRLPPVIGYPAAVAAVGLTSGVP
jgi:hypothetical protein